MTTQPRVVTTATGGPADPRALVVRYRNALADALSALDGFGHEEDAKDIAARYSLVYVQPKPEVRLGMSVPPAERLFDEITR